MLRAVTDFYLFEILAVLRLRMTVRTARDLLVGLYVLAVPLVFIVAMAGFSLIRPILEKEGVQAEELLIAVAVLLLYWTTTYALREAFSQRRFMMSGSSNAALFRAKDISSREVFLVYCVRRICAYHRGYDYDRYRRLVRARRITPKIVRRGVLQGSGLGKARWVVERTFAWLHQFKRLRIRYEIRADLHLGLLQLACSVTCLRQLRSSF